MNDHQNNINLLPESVRLRCEAGLRIGRYITAVVAGLIVVIVAATLSSIEHDRAQERLKQARGTAALVLQTEERAAQIQVALDEAQQKIEVYERIDMPIQLSSLLATIVNRLPASVTLERVDLRTGRSTGRAMRVPSRAGTSVQTRASDADARPRRVLTGEISGFAASDEEIAGLISTLRQTRPLESISLDFSRTRMVRSHPAREFRVSFQIDLETVYEKDFPDPGSGLPTLDAAMLDTATLSTEPKAGGGGRHG